MVAIQEKIFMPVGTAITMLANAKYARQIEETSATAVVATDPTRAVPARSSARCAPRDTAADRTVGAKKMNKKTLTAALMAVTATAVALPAAAQSYRGYAQDLNRQISNLDNRVDRARANRTISAAEHRRLDAQVGQVRATFRQYMRDGRLTNWERQNVNVRIDRVQAQLRSERRDNDRRPY